MSAVQLPVPDLFALMRRGGAFVSALMVCATPALADMSSQAKRSENKDGSSSMVFSNELADLGAEVGVSVSEPAVDELADPAAGQVGYTGSAFAKVTVKLLPDWMIWDKGALNVTLNPADEGGKVATTFSRTVDVMPGLKAVVADTYSFERTTSGEAWETDKSVSLKVEQTGTIFAVAAKASEDEVGWQPSVSAIQKLPGGLNLTTKVSDTGSEIDKSVMAGLTHRW